MLITLFLCQCCVVANTEHLVLTVEPAVDIQISYSPLVLQFDIHEWNGRGGKIVYLLCCN